MITKEIELDKIEIVFVEGFPHTQARGKIVIKEDGKHIADAGTIRFGAKGPDQDAGNQPDISFSGEKVKIDQGVKDTLRAVQDSIVTEQMKNDYKVAKIVEGDKL